MCAHSVEDTSVIIIFFFNDTATTEIYTLSLHDALPISGEGRGEAGRQGGEGRGGARGNRPSGPCIQGRGGRGGRGRSEEHTAELQSRQYLVCRLLLEKKKHTTPQLLFQLPTLYVVNRCV